MLLSFYQDENVSYCDSARFKELGGLVGKYVAIRSDKTETNLNTDRTFYNYESKSGSQPNYCVLINLCELALDTA